MDALAITHANETRTYIIDFNIFLGVLHSVQTN